MELMDRLRDFNLREKLNDNQHIVVIVCVVMIAVALGYVYLISDSPRPSGPVKANAYYYDTVSGEYFVGDSRQYPPITSPDGNPAVRAHFFTCTESCDKADRFVGYYEKYTEQAKVQLESMRESELDYSPEMYEWGVLHSLDAKQWFNANSEEAGTILAERLKCEDGPRERARYCRAD